MNVDTKVLATIKKLLTLAANEGATEGEAANAAARAQALMTKHRIHDAMLDIEDSEDADNIQDWKDPLDRARRMPGWKSQLAMAIAEPNNCQIYLSGGDLMIIGEEMDADTVRYLYAFIIKQIMKLRGNYVGYSRTWKNNWRHGIIDTLRFRLREAKAEAIAEVYAEANTAGTSLVIVDNALAVIDRRINAVAEIGKKIGLKSRGRSSFSGDYDARSTGRRDGNKINIGGGGGRSLGGGQRRLGGD